MHGDRYYGESYFIFTLAQELITSIMLFQLLQVNQINLY